VRGGPDLCKFVAFNVAASGRSTVKVPALVSSAAPPNGTLLNSDFWVQDSTPSMTIKSGGGRGGTQNHSVVAPVSQLPAPVGSASVSASGARASPVVSRPRRELEPRGGPAAGGGPWGDHRGRARRRRGAGTSSPWTMCWRAGRARRLCPKIAAGFPAQRVRTEFAVHGSHGSWNRASAIGRHALDLSRAMTRLEPGILARNARSS